MTHAGSFQLLGLSQCKLVEGGRWTKPQTSNCKRKDRQLLQAALESHSGWKKKIMINVGYFALRENFVFPLCSIKLRLTEQHILPAVSSWSYLDKLAVQILFQALFQPRFKFGLSVSKWVLQQMEVEVRLCGITASNTMVKSPTRIVWWLSRCRRVFCRLMFNAV